MASEVTLTIDGEQLTVPAGTLLVEAAKRVRKDIPVYCYHPKLGPAGLCRICLVEVEKTPKLQIACNTVVTEGMVVHTQNEKVDDGRRAVLEFLLLNHPLDCPICDKGGECDLQDYSMAYGQGASRKLEAKDPKPKAVDLGPTIVLDEERCIVCQRCVRFDDIITQEQSLVVKDRGQKDVIATATQAPYRSDFSGNVTELCPVGALTSKTYRFKSRPWDLARTQSTCTQCSVGCTLNIDVRYDDVLRTMSEEGDEAQSDGWLCDRGRYNIGFYRDARRLVSPLLRSGNEWTQISWEDAIGLWARKLKEALASAGPQAIGVIGGGRLLNEEIVLAQHLFRALGTQNLDWRAGRQLSATPRGSGTLHDLEMAKTILVLGVPPSQSAPVLDLRIRKAVSRHHARLISVGDFAAASFVLETHVGSAAQIPQEALTVDRLAVVWDGIDVSLYESVMEQVHAQRPAGSPAVHEFLCGEQGNARGAEAFGMLPAQGGLGTAGMFEAARRGELSALCIFGANPILRFADGALAREALAKLPFVVVSDLFMTQTAEHATLVLPAQGAFEKSGHTMSVTGDILPVHAGLAPLPGTLSDGEMLVALAAELEIEIPAPDVLTATARISPARAESVGEMGQRRIASKENAGALRVCIATSIFTGGGTLAHDERVEGLRDLPTVTLSPHTALVLGVTEGDVVDLVDEERTLSDLFVVLSAAASDGTVTIVDGIPDAPANSFVAGESVTLMNIRSAYHELAGAPA
ncbi:MAG TPA: molybdopterin-dependent oxidoreductase [Candidatus Acidoferrales bacterium]|nr:molybdopterin-dependent oxidoreductase [Candidatus Acidoferrales bacterium]